MWCFFLLLFIFPQNTFLTLTMTPPIPQLFATVKCITSVDPSIPIVIEVYRNWAPIGAARFLELIKDKYYDNSPIFRVVKVFISCFITLCVFTHSNMDIFYIS
jgi:hypothetical protein